MTVGRSNLLKTTLQLRKLESPEAEVLEAGFNSKVHFVVPPREDVIIYFHIYFLKTRHDEYVVDFHYVYEEE